MRSAARAAAGAAALLVGALALLSGTPVVGAQQNEPEPTPPAWEGSGFEEPTAFVTELREDRIDTSGRFRFRKPTATSEIVGATITLVDDTSDDFVPDGDCDFREVDVPSDGTSASETVDELLFDVTGYPLVCNGRYLLEATARTDADESFTLQAALVVEVLPPAVTAVEVAEGATTQEITVRWTPVAPDRLPVDVVGYLVERAGPQDEDGSFGIFEDLVVVGRDAEPARIDQVPEPGTYRYRIRTVRPGPRGTLLSNILDSDTETVTVDDPPPTTSTTAPSTTGRSSVGASIPRIRPRAPLSPPTTADTGFEETLDYGDLPARPTTSASVPELASEDPQAGQSVVHDEGDGGIDIIIPAAGALVLLGWAGHLAYLNRLAKQL